ncbi:MAG: hypothetical protein IT378_11985 [Sandaracinaceae bacterium]|nr:hypothetical protein [Sandaracinaceae bacterium]
MRHTVYASFIVASLTASVAAAQQAEITTELALLDRSTTGTPDSLAGYGYDNDAGLSAGLDARLFVDRISDYFHHGPFVGVAHHGGALLGLVDDHAFQTTLIDAGYAARLNLPCMSRGAIKWYVSGQLGLTGVIADAGTGNGGRPNGDRWNERLAASSSLDHGGLGWRLALSLDAHWGPMILGLALGLRQYFGIDSPVGRGWLMNVGLRVGVRFGD